jgi:putative addiction module component (TIGR02574 family)
MTTTAIEKRVLKWPTKQKVALAEKLLASVENFASREIEQAWEEEIERRSKEIEAGEAAGIPAEQVFAKARNTLRETRRLSQAGRGRAD